MTARNSNRSRFGLLTILTALWLVVGALAGAQAKAAGDYQLVPCHFQNLDNRIYGLWPAFPEAGAAPWSMQASCPVGAQSEVAFQLSSAVDVDEDWRGFEFPAGNAAANTINSVSFSLLGSNGDDGNLQQSVAVCSPTLCSEPIRPSGSNVSAPEAHSLVAADLPSGANHIRVQGRCPATQACAIARTLKLRNLIIVFADRIAPTIEFSDQAIDPGLPPLVPWIEDEAKVWHSWKVTPRVRLDVAAADAESGVQWVKYEFFRLDSFPPLLTGWWWREYKFCGTPLQTKIGALCPKTAQEEMSIQPQGAMNNFGIREGKNRVVVAAFDVAGNKSPTVSHDFLVDSIAPTLRVTSPAESKTHWQSSKFASINWLNTGESAETDIDSGLAGVRWQVFDASTGEKMEGFEGDQQGALDALDSIELPGEGIWRVDVATYDHAGNKSTAGAQQSAIFGVDSTLLDAPLIDSIATQGAAAVAAGVGASWQAPANSSSVPSGNCGFAFAVDQHPDSDPGLSIEADVDHLGLNLKGPFLDGVNYLHLRAVSCAGVGGGVGHMPFSVDTNAPQLAISNPGPAGWHSESYPLTASIVSDSGSGTTMSLALDGAAHVFHPVSSLSAPMTEGSHLLTAIAQDAVGNSSTLVASVQIDAAPPVAAIAEFDPARPTRIRVAVSDSGSGVTEAQLQYRAVGSGPWQDAGDGHKPTAGAAAALDFEQTLPDVDMPDGVYELRVVARDNASYVTSVTDAAAKVKLPLRRAPLLTAAFQNLHKTRTCRTRDANGRCAKYALRERVVSQDFALGNVGQSASLSGRLIAVSGEPMGGARVEILESSIGSQSAVVAALTTDDSGRFIYRVSPGISRRVIARFAGDELNAPGQTAVKFLVRPNVALRVTQKRMRTSSLVTFKGRVEAPGATMPSAGLPIKIEFLTRARGKTISITGKSDRRGRFAITHRFKPQSRAVRFTVRAAVPWFRGWSYESGRSELRSFVIR